MESSSLNDDNGSSTLRSLVHSIKERRTKSPVLYLIVIGFHHKKGCQIEHVYPNDFRPVFELASKRSHKQAEANGGTATATATDADVDLCALPRRWKYLASLALPDGSHNYESDYVYFHLEDFDESDFVVGGEDEGGAATIGTGKELNVIKKVLPTVFGISCYRQIDAAELIAKDSEVTRNTLQKSVCILSSQPLYGSIRAKLESITLAYFNQKDFRKTEILDKAFAALAKTYEYVRSPSGRLSLPRTLPNYLNTTADDSAASSSSSSSLHHVGFSVGDLVLRYQHKALTLFKLLLLQKKCLFQLNPVSNLSNTILTLVSLVPDVFVDVAAGSSTGGSGGQSKSLENLIENEVYSTGHLTSSTGSCLDSNFYQFCSGFFNSVDLIDNELERKGQIRSTADATKAPKPLPRLIESANDSRPTSVSSLACAIDLKLKTNGTTTSSNEDTDGEHVHLDLSQPQPLQSQQQQHGHSTGGSEGGRRKKNGANLPKYASKKVAQDQIKRLKDLNDSKNSSASSANSNGGYEEEETGQTKSQLPVAAADRSSSGGGLGFFKSKFSKITNILTSPSPLPGLKPPQQSSPVTMSAVNPRLQVTAASPQDRDELGGLETPTKQQQASYPGGESLVSAEETARTFQKELEEFLRTDFGMPLKLFSEFNILHPYLSLYYMDYFGMVNKMSTTLFCTTFKLNNMNRYAKVDSDNVAAANDKVDEAGDTAESQQNNSGLWNDSWTANNDTIGSYRPPSAVVDVESKIGYTIGATNVLFKQRLQDKLDALIDDVEIDLNGNEELKKQLELTTADQRFMYFIIKNVNEHKAAAASLDQQNGGSSSSTSPVDQRGAAVRSSIRRSTSVNIHDKSSSMSASEDKTATASAADKANGPLSQVGSDEWVRSYFRWYLYSLLGSMLREDFHQSFRTDLDVLVSTNMDHHPHHHHDNKDVISINESIASLDNSSSMIDINDVLYEDTAAAAAPTKDSQAALKAKSTSTNSMTGDEAATAATAVAKQSRFLKHKKIRSSRQSRDTASVSSMATTNATTGGSGNSNNSSSAILDYRDDFNKHFVDEFKKTSCYRDWFARNKSQLAVSIFKLQSPIDQSINIDVLDPSSKSLALKVIMSDLQSLEQNTIAHPFNTTNGGSYLNDMKVKMSFLFSSTESGKRINKALTESSKVLSGVFKTAFSPFLKQQQQQQQQQASSQSGEAENETSTKM